MISKHQSLRSFQINALQRKGFWEIGRHEYEIVDVKKEVPFVERGRRVVILEFQIC